MTARASTRPATAPRRAAGVKAAVDTAKAKVEAEVRAETATLRMEEKEANGRLPTDVGVGPNIAGIPRSLLLNLPVGSGWHRALSVPQSSLTPKGTASQPQ